MVVFGDQVFDQLARHLRQGRQRLDPRLHLVQAVAQRHRAGHTGAALDGVGRAHQPPSQRRVGRRLQPAAQILADRRQQFVGFLDEQRQQIGIEFIASGDSRRIVLDRRRRRFRLRDERACVDGHAQLAQRVGLQALGQCTDRGQCLGLVAWHRAAGETMQHRSGAFDRVHQRVHVRLVQRMA